MIAAAAGARVAKHGNRSVSSLCGSADVLEALGVAVDVGPEGIRKCLEGAGIAFMFAPRCEPAAAGGCLACSEACGVPVWRVWHHVS